MVRVLSFSLWGNNPTYLVGAVKNAEQANIAYPTFQCWFYVHEPTVPQETIELLKTYGNVKIILKDGDLNTTKPSMWRFEAIDDPDVEIMMSRDTDTRIWKREKLAVEEWLASDKIFHIMRDHPWHNSKIQAGMFGVKKTDQRWDTLMNQAVQGSERTYDQTFLANAIYPIYRNSLMIHASFHKMEGAECSDFHMTHAEDDYRFVGEYVYYDESRNAKNRQELVRGHL